MKNNFYFKLGIIFVLIIALLIPCRRTAAFSKAGRVTRLWQGLCWLYLTS
jgi:hypothetical protein